MRPRLHYVDDGAPAETADLLEAAARDRGVGFVHVDATLFDWAESSRARPGDLLYRGAASLAAVRVEQFLHAPGVAAPYPDDVALFFHDTNPPLWYARAGLPVVPMVHGLARDRGRLRTHAEALGGFPVVVKTLGFSGGAGVVRADSCAALFSLADYALAHGHEPVLMRYLEGATHWRVVVVGARAVAAYRNVVAPDDFRTTAVADPTAYARRVPARLARLATAATARARVELAGVDLLVTPAGDGRRAAVHLLEVNSPCHFAYAQRVGGVDVAGALVEHLLAKRGARATGRARRGR